jgi:hypothetical protein
MTRIELLVTKLLVIGSGIALVTISASQSVSAQVPCPPGYYFSYGYGCVPAAQQSASEQNDLSAYRGWENVQFGIIDLWRVRLPGDTIH